MKHLFVLFLVILPMLAFADEESVGFLGVSTEELSEAMKIALDIKHGLLVVKVHEGAPAEKTDIKVGDIILEIDGETITDYQALKSVVEARPNKRVNIVLYRSRSKITKDIELAERKKKVSIDIDLPDLENLKYVLSKGTDELKDEIETLKQDMEKLKEELKELKEKVK